MLEAKCSFITISQIFATESRKKAVTADYIISSNLEEQYHFRIRKILYKREVICSGRLNSLKIFEHAFHVNKVVKKLKLYSC